MRRMIALLAVIVLVFVLCACGNGLCFDEGPKIQFAKENAELLDRCINTICSEYQTDDYIRFFTENSRLFVWYGPHSIGEEVTEAEIENADLSELFSTGQVKRIIVLRSKGSLDSITFLMGSIGMGSTSSANIVYIPSDKLEVFYYFSDQMHFYAFHGGQMGIIDGSDDYLFYVQISPRLYYIEYGD